MKKKELNEDQKLILSLKAQLADALEVNRQRYDTICKLQNIINNTYSEKQPEKVFTVEGSKSFETIALNLSQYLKNTSQNYEN